MPRKKPKPQTETDAALELAKILSNQGYGVTLSGHSRDGKHHTLTTIKPRPSKAALRRRGLK